MASTLGPLTLVVLGVGVWLVPLAFVVVPIAVGRIVGRAAYRRLSG